MVKISVLIVTRNAEKHILSCLKSIINQFPDNNGWELIIVDGMSKDKTRKIVEDYLKDKGVEYRVVDNPRFTLATGWNLGVSVAKGDYVVRPDAHAELLDNYILNGVAHLDKEPEW